MPEYVYALHDFHPEHEDEVSFLAGERIEVVEKDDQFGDGWWQGCNLAGKVGLFPVSYTAPAPPEAESAPSTSNEPSVAAKSVLQPLPEESETEGPTIMSPVPKAPPATFLNGDGGYESADESLHLDSVPDGEVMKATMTDVQKAIEQLGRGGATGEDGDGARSFSFASTRDGGDTETDTDFDFSDVEAPLEANGEDWHKNARRKLADKARMALQSAQKLEEMMEKETRRPPIEVELSDESDPEDDFTRVSKFQRDHLHILEEDENEEAETSPKDVESQHTSTVENQVLLPAKDETEVPTATKWTFPAFSPPPAVDSGPEPEIEQRSPSPEKSVYATPAAVVQPTPSPETETKRNSVPTPVANGIPSPTASHFNHSKHNSIVSTISAPAVTTSPPQVSRTPPQPQPPAMATSPQPVKETHPTDWSLDEVVEWLKTKGFDQDVCDKFIEQEITGDVLLELDANLLKSEIGIMAFGKRVRIANAIADLRRPPSIEYSDHQVSSSEHPSPMQLQYSNTHSRTQSVSQSHHSFPGTTTTAPGHGYSQSVQSSLGSPIGGFSGPGGFAFGAVPPAPAAPQSLGTQVNGSGVGVASAAAATATAMGVGLGIALSPVPSSNEGVNGTSRPAHLSQSPSDGALKHTVSRNSLDISKAKHREDDDRGHMSDGEVVPTASSMRRRIFGRSHDSSVSIGNHSSKYFSPLPSPTVHETPDKDIKEKGKGKEKEKEKEGSVKEKDAGRDSSSIGSRPRSKKSVDGTRHGDRLSIFAGTFGGNLGKGRKPPPSADDHSTEKSSKFSLPRLGGSGIRKSSSQSHRSSTPSGSPKDFISVGAHDSPFEPPKREPATLRKRTVSAPHTSPGSPTSPEGFKVNGVSGASRQGQNILDQIGEPDHAGWMRKRGDKYNGWKLRYCVLKGPDLYILKSDNKTQTRAKGHILIDGFKVTVDETVDPGRYGFRIDHDNGTVHYFSSEEKSVIRDWMKAIMKATIGRDYSKPVVSSCNIPTIPLIVAQAMNPAPRPPSPTARDATQKAMRRENPDQLSSRDARVLMGLSGNEAKEERARLDSFFSDEAMAAKQAANQTPKKAAVPPRPSREMRRSNSVRTMTSNVADGALIDWANSHLPEELQILDPNGPLCGGLGLLRLAESIRGRPSSPPVHDSAFPLDANDDKLDGLFRLFDFLLDNEVKMGSVSINDVRQGKRDKILQLLRALKAWEDKRKALASSLSKGTTHGSYMGLM